MSAQSRASKARIELEETNAALDGLKLAALTEIAESGLADSDKRERLYLFTHAIGQLKDALGRVIAEGEVANYRQALAEQGLTRP